MAFQTGQKVAGPLVSPGEQAHPAMAADPASCILLVDDDPIIRESVGAMLNFIGWDSVSVASGEEACSTLTDGLKAALVILDLDMPGWGGAATLPRLRALRPSLPVVISTGRVQDTAVALASRYPRVGLMPKPYGLGELKRCLAEWCVDSQV